MPTEARMSRSEPNSRSAHRAAASEAMQGPRGTLRVLSEDGRVGRPSSVVMPSANTDLAAMLARDVALCVRPLQAQKAAAPQPASEIPTASPQPPVEAELARLIDVWPSLSASVRAAMVAAAYEAAADEK
jgi:hypothetical protein